MSSVYAVKTGGRQLVRGYRKYDSALHHKNRNTRYHVQTASIQTNYLKDVNALFDVIEKILGNPFNQASNDMIIRDTKEIVDPSAVTTVQKAHTTGKEQFDAFTKECVMERTV